jgi:hypothetical protein
MIKVGAGAALCLILSSPAVFAQTEPWGGHVPGWTFTQTAEAGDVINCRATQGAYLISRSSNGRAYVSVPPPAGLPRGRYAEGRASIVIGGAAEPIDAEVTGRLLFYIDDTSLQALARSGGYQWRVAGPKGILTGAVSFMGNVAKAVAEVRACARANTSAPPPAAAPAAGRNLRWSGDWFWIRPLTIFGKPTNTKSLSIELLKNNHVNICFDLARRDTCKSVPFTVQNGVYRLSYGGSDLYEIRLVGNTLDGAFWWKRENRGKTGPDATFVLN